MNSQQATLLSNSALIFVEMSLDPSISSCLLHTGNSCTHSWMESISNSSFAFLDACHCYRFHWFRPGIKYHRSWDSSLPHAFFQLVISNLHLRLHLYHLSPPLRFHCCDWSEGFWLSTQMKRDLDSLECLFFQHWVRRSAYQQFV